MIESDCFGSCPQRGLCVLPHSCGQQSGATQVWRHGYSNPVAMASSLLKKKISFHVPAWVMEHCSPGCFWHPVRYLHRLLWAPDSFSKPWWVREQLGLWWLLALLKIKLSLQTATCYAPSPSPSPVHFKTEKYIWTGDTGGSKPYNSEDVILSFSCSKRRRKSRVLFSLQELTGVSPGSEVLLVCLRIHVCPQSLWLVEKRCSYLVTLSFLRVGAGSQ